VVGWLGELNLVGWMGCKKYMMQATRHVTLWYKQGVRSFSGYGGSGFFASHCICICICRYEQEGAKHGVNWCKQGNGNQKLVWVKHGIWGDFFWFYFSLWLFLGWDGINGLRGWEYGGNAMLWMRDEVYDG
jgi:hypothetical protein